MKMDPKGSKPPTTPMTPGEQYQAFSGIGRGMVLTRHGLFGTPFQFRPMTVPKSTSGKETNAHINANTTMVPNGAAAKEW